MSKKHLISISGPTAIGKTALSIRLAREFKTEILSADSRQFYKEMRIGTAAPSAEELKAAPHHFIHHISIEEEYSVGDFERDALAKVEELFQKNSVVILVGGSGLYIKSFLEGLDYFPDVDPGIRKSLNNTFSTKGLEPLRQRLQQLDSDHFSRIDVENPHRVIRALEICIGTGKPYSSFLNRDKSSRKFETIKIGLSATREVIYDRINKRVDIMMEEGLLEEVQKLYTNKNLNALNTVGYKELFRFIEGKTSLDEAVEEIKKNTRRFAKRQLTWFRKDEDIQWFEHTTAPEEIVSFIEEKMNSRS